MRLLVLLVASALAACGSVQSGGADASGRGGGGSNVGTGGAGTGGAVGGASGASGERGGAGGASAGTGGATGGRGGSGGAAGTFGTCGGQICGVQDICCGPAECPRCMNIPSNSCPTTCGGAGGGSAGRGGAGGSAGSGSAGRGGTGGSSAGRGGAGGSAGGGSAGRGGTDGTDGRMSCQGDGDCQGFKCCGGFCTNPGNDIFNCGTCGTTCAGARPYCANGTCQSSWPCSLVGATCAVPSACCGEQCCTGTQICCTVTIGPTVTRCFEPVNGTCPLGCLDCNCAAPTTPIATPAGNRPIAALAVGDLVYSIDHGSLAVVPVKRVHRQPVTGSHRVVELKLVHGATLRVSPRHPTADGRQFGDLVAGALVDGVRVNGVRLVEYDHPFTYDILPDSDSGAYFAGGTLIGSTLSDRSDGLGMSTVAASGSLRRASVLPPITR